MGNDKCVTKEADKLAEFICASKQPNETEYICTMFVCLYIFQTYEKREKHIP